MIAILAMPVLLIVAWVKLVRLGRRVADLERRLRERTASSAAERPDSAPPSSSSERSPRMAAVATPRHSAPQPAPAAMRRQPSPVSSKPSAATVVTGLRVKVTDWFTSGNVPVKVGMLVLLAGVGALLKYAADAGWLAVPIELRLAAVGLAGLAALAFGWRQRRARPVFGLSLQGGAVGVLLMALYAAFRLYGLLPAELAFGLAVVLVAGTGVLAVLQDALVLAIIGLLAGFAAPILMSTGAGSHVVLFSYYAVLNLGILGIARYRGWRLLNLLGFVFTFGIGVAWGVLEYEPAQLASVQPFLVLFFAIYLAIPLLDRARVGAGHGRFVDGSLVFGNPLIAFALQAALLEGARMPLAYCALGVAALYVLLAWLQPARPPALLRQSFAVLAAGFATLAVPLALSAHATASVFALEGAGLVWLGLRQRHRLTEYAGLGLQALAVVAFAQGQALAPAAERAIANPAFMGALLIAAAAFASALSYHLAGRRRRAPAMLVWGLLWWGLMGWFEAQRFLPAPLRPDALLAFSAITLLLATAAHAILRAPALGWTLVALFAAALPLVIWQASGTDTPLTGYGAGAWAAFVPAGVWALWRLRRADRPQPGWAHSLWLAALLAMVSFSAVPALDDLGLGNGWLLAAGVLPWVLVCAAVVAGQRWLALPLAPRFDEWRRPLGHALVAVVAILGALALGHSGDSEPLTWLPLLNPVELTLVGAFAVVTAWARAPATGFDGRQRALLLSGAGFVLASDFTLRAVHQLGDVDWSPAMLGASVAQTSLTVVWSALGVTGWIVGSRRGLRGVWLAGAILMGVVLAKLLVVDRQNLGNVTGVVSFIAYGLLCTAVGYVAPAPPAQAPPATRGEQA